MRRIAILSLNDLRHITMIKIYTDYFDAHNIAYDIICTERYGKKEVAYRNSRVYFLHIPGMETRKAKKVLGFMRFRSYAKKIIQQNNYEYIVVWDELTTVVFSDILRKCKKYCVNIRDIGFPQFPLFWTRLSKAIKSSDFSTWCAQNGLEYLPKHEYVIVLNQNKELVKDAIISDGLVDRGCKIRLGVVGYIRHIEASKRLMEALNNDNRYIVQFFGTGSRKLLEYANQIGMNNIETEESFESEKTKEYLNRIDVINAFCGDGKENQAITVGAPIRYGYSTKLYKPAIVSPNTYLSEKTSSLNIAYTIKDLKKFPDEFYEWYHLLDFKTFKRHCDMYNKEYDKSLEDFYKVCDKKILPFVNK